MQEFPHALGTHAEGFLGPSQWEPRLAYIPDFGPGPDEATEGIRTQGAPPDYPAAQAYAACLVAQRCLGEPGAGDESLWRAACALDCGDAISIPQPGLQVGHEMILVQWRRGRKLVVWPPPVSKARPLYPRPQWTGASGSANLRRTSMEAMQVYHLTIQENGHSVRFVYEDRDEALTRFADAIAAGLDAKLDEVVRAPALPKPTERLPDEIVPVRHQGELLEAVSIEKKPGESLTPTERKLVSDLGSQAGLVPRNVALIADLRASRQRLVAAQDDERRKLERNLHDGAQQQLVALAVKLRLAESLAERDPSATKTMLTDLRTETGEALESLRDLARGIYPPLLADKGLAAALESQARKGSVPTEVRSEGIGRYPPDVEAAVYFCALEALNNVAKYAGATRAEVRLAQADGELTFEVSDDGDGFDPAQTGYGTGLQGMADRLDAIGGTLKVHSQPGKGVQVTGRVPV